MCCVVVLIIHQITIFLSFLCATSRCSTHTSPHRHHLSKQQHNVECGAVIIHSYYISRSCWTRTRQRSKVSHLRNFEKCSLVWNWNYSTFVAVASLNIVNNLLVESRRRHDSPYSLGLIVEIIFIALWCSGRIFSFSFFACLMTT